MNHAKPGAQAVALALALVVFFGGLSASGCSPSRKITVESDLRVFTLFAGLAAVGYGEEQADPASETLRSQVKETLADWTADYSLAMTSFEQNYQPDELISAVLQLGPPPDFTIELEFLAPGLRALLATLWTQVGPLYESQANAEALKAMADPAAAVIQGAVDYAGGKAPCQTWRVVPESLVLSGCSYSCRAGETAWIVLSRASASWQSDLAREVFRVLVHDGLERLGAEGALERFWPLLELAQLHGDLQYDGDVSAYVEENLVWALAARVLDASERESALNAATDKGFALAPDLYDRLADYDASGQTLPSYLGQLLAGVHIDAALARAALPPDFPTQPLPEGWDWVRITYKGKDRIESWWAATGMIPAGKIYAPFAGRAGVGSSAGLVTSYRPSERTEIYEGYCISISGLERGLLVEGLPGESIPIKDGDFLAVQSGQVLVTLEEPCRVLVWFQRGEATLYASLKPVPIEVLTALLNGG